MTKPFITGWSFFPDTWKKKCVASGAGGCFRLWPTVHESGPAPMLPACAPFFSHAVATRHVASCRVMSHHITPDLRGSSSRGLPEVCRTGDGEEQARCAGNTSSSSGGTSSSGNKEQSDQEDQDEEEELQRHQQPRFAGGSYRKAESVVVRVRRGVTGGEG